ncbi:MAG TPA: SDR family oxidoreductase [Candidatus Sumerlaeia bacterium]|nr:SDR family oxidoreductase [Candidatus Sumerlaeia bacterium]
MKQLKIFITGASSFLGLHVLNHLQGKGYDVYALRHAAPLPKTHHFNAVDADLEESGSIALAAKGIYPDVVLHIAALAQTELCEKEPERARRINVDATSELLKLFSSESTRFIYVSTDLVFDGLRGNYNESDMPNPLMVYAKTKFEAEELVKAWGKNHAIIRVALLYGPALGRKQSFAGWIESSLEKGKATLFKDEFRTPLYVEDAANALVRLIDSNFCGVMHLGGADRCSRYEFGVELARQGGYELSNICSANIKDAQLNYYRPPDVSLDSSLAKKNLGIVPISIKEGIGRYLLFSEKRGSSK